MEPHIDGVKEQVLEVMRSTKAANCEVVGLAFVGYKDWCAGPSTSRCCRSPTT